MLRDLQHEAASCIMIESLSWRKESCSVKNGVVLFHGGCVCVKLKSRVGMQHDSLLSLSILRDCEHFQRVRWSAEMLQYLLSLM